MGKFGVSDIKTIKEVVTTTAKAGFVTFILTMLQYGLLFALGFMIFEYDRVIEMFNGNLYQYAFFILAAVIILYLIMQRISKDGQTTVIDTYVKKQDELKVAEKLAEKRKHDINVENRMEIMPEIRNLLNESLIALDAGRVTLFEMHNGTNNMSGVPFLYAKLTSEVFTPECGSTMDEYKDFDMSRYPYGVNHYKECFKFNTIDEIELEDPILALKMRICKAQALAIMVINGKHNKLGFLTVTFPDKNNVPEKATIIAQMTSLTQSIASYLDID